MQRSLTLRRPTIPGTQLLLNGASRQSMRYNVLSRVLSGVWKDYGTSRQPEGFVHIG